jgi:subtilisin family serine protease
VKIWSIVRTALLCVALSGATQTLSAQGVVLRANHNVVLRSEDDTTAILKKGKAAGFKPSVLLGRVVTFRLTLNQMNAFGDSMRAWPEIGRNSDGRLMVDWDAEIKLPKDSTEAMALPLDADPTWSVVAVHATEAWKLGIEGQGVITAALDGAGGWGHPGLNIAGGWNATQVGDTSQGYQNDPNCNSHGVHTASSMSGNKSGGVGSAPASSVLMIRVFETVGSCVAYVSSTLRGANYAADHGAKILNVSIGHGSTYSGEAVAASLRARGVLFFGSNGNSGASGAYWPAYDTNAVGSAAIDANGNRASWSNYGVTTDFGSPGVNVLGAIQGGGYGTKSGTSMASPTTAGAFALALSAEPTKTWAEIITAFRATADSLSGATPNIYTGYGRPNAAKAIAYLRGGAATTWSSKSYTTGTAVTDSVYFVCATANCTVTGTGAITILRTQPYIVFTTTGPSTLRINTGPLPTVPGALPPPPPPPPGGGIIIGANTVLSNTNAIEARK